MGATPDRIAQISQAQQRLPETCQAIDACASMGERKKMLRDAICQLGVELNSTRAHQAMGRYLDGGESTEVILREMVEFERVARQSWIDTALQPWCDRHGLTLKQGLSVLFDDSPFNPETKRDDLANRERVLGWSGQQNDFACRLIDEIKHQDDILKDAGQREAIQEIRVLGVQRWDVMEGSESAVPNEPTYDIRVMSNRAGVSVDITPIGYDEAMASEGNDPRLQLPQLSVTVEINNGVPCVHVHGDCRGQLAQTIFGLPDGRVALRNVDDPGMRELVTRVQENFDAPLDEIAERFAQAMAATPSDVQVDPSAGDAP